MEKKKLLLVAVSVGVFLVLVAGAAILVFSPQKPGLAAGSQVPASPETSSRSATADPAEMLKSEDLLGLQEPGADSPIQENKISTSGEPSEIAAKVAEPKAVISVPRPQSAAVPETSSAKPAVKPQSQAAQSVKPPAAAKPAVSAAPANPASQKKTGKDYWVQAGAYSTRDRADNVKDGLADKGITAIITNQQVNSQTYYRVRIGPYTSKNEADYWLAMIKSIDGFENSLVWENWR